MDFIPDRFYHIYNQGNNRQRIFNDDSDDYILFLRLTRKHVLPHVDIIAYCLMPNHFHMIVKTDSRCLNKRMSGRIEIGQVSFGLKMLTSSFTLTVNKRCDFHGSIFRKKTNARLLNHDSAPTFVDQARQDDSANVFRYIHDNPLKANMVQNPADWMYSSYRDYAGLRNGTLINKTVALEFGIDWV